MEEIAFAEPLKINGMNVDPNPVVRLLSQTFPDYGEVYNWENEKGDIMWIPTSIDKIPEIADELEIKSGDRIYDLGSGDGRVLAGLVILSGGTIQCVGYEKRPTLVNLSKQLLKNIGLDDRIGIRCKDILREDLAELRRATKVYCFLYDSMNLAVASQLEKYLPNSAIVLSRYYRMPRSWEKYSVQSKPDYHKFCIRR
jgi:SAM-dependent methyltransferase